MRTRLLFPLVTLTLALVAIEVGLQAFAKLAPSRYRILIGKDVPLDRRAVRDNRLGFRPSSTFPGHDKRGFRNEFVPPTAAIVTLGDSQTYGQFASIEESWPQQLRGLTNQSVYNMAFGGWGPTHGLMILDEAKTFRPKLIIASFYSGNDLFDSFAHVYYLDQLSELKSSSQKRLGSIVVQEELETQEHVENLGTRVRGFYMRPKVTNDSRLSRIERGLANHCRLYQLALRVQQLYDPNRGSDWESVKTRCLNSHYCQVFESSDAKTLFTSESRLAGADLDDVRIQEGFRISLEALRRMSEEARAAQIAFAVLLIPTKELVYKDAVYAQTNEIPASYSRVIGNEELVWQKSKEFLTNNGIRFIDALPALREFVHKGVPPYFSTEDGHPNAAGHRAIAEAVEKEILRSGLLGGQVIEGIKQ